MAQLLVHQVLQVMLQREQSHRFLLMVQKVVQVVQTGTPSHAGAGGGGSAAPVAGDATGSNGGAGGIGGTTGVNSGAGNAAPTPPISSAGAGVLVAVVEVAEHSLQLQVQMVEQEQLVLPEVMDKLLLNGLNNV